MCFGVYLFLDFDCRKINIGSGVNYDFYICVFFFMLIDFLKGSRRKLLKYLRNIKWKIMGFLFRKERKREK